jgi:hypothetical protein
VADRHACGRHRRARGHEHGGQRAALRRAPTDWIGTLSAIPLDDLRFERWTGTSWVPADLNELVPSPPEMRWDVPRCAAMRLS